MTQEKGKEIIEKLGLKVGEISDDFAEKVASYKEELDTETRREVRKRWIIIAGICAVVGFFAGLIF